MKTVNHEKFLELVKRLETLKDTLPGMESLVDTFSNLGQLMGKFQQEANIEAKEAAWLELKACQKRLEDEFSEICKGWGMEIDDVRAFVDNPINYTPDEWRGVQDIKADVDGLNEVSRRSVGIRQSRLRKWA